MLIVLFFLIFCNACYLFELVKVLLLNVPLTTDQFDHFTSFNFHVVVWKHYLDSVSWVHKEVLVNFFLDILLIVLLQLLLLNLYSSVIIPNFLEYILWLPLKCQYLRLSLLVDITISASATFFISGFLDIIINLNDSYHVLNEKSN